MSCCRCASVMLVSVDAISVNFCKMGTNMFGFWNSVLPYLISVSLYARPTCATLPSSCALRMRPVEDAICCRISKPTVSRPALVLKPVVYRSSRFSIWLVKLATYSGSLTSFSGLVMKLSSSS